MKALLELIRANKAGQPLGIYSVCSAHPQVLMAALAQAKQDGSKLLIEATANQVNQYGGYTGMQPSDFIAFVFKLADEISLNRQQILFGGDHLGPVCWKHQPAAQAMAQAEKLIEVYVAAGFQKIHLDTSMACADDVLPLADTLIAQRAARLCQVAEQTSMQQFGHSELCYVIGTEVPAPGGVASLEASLAVTPVGHVAQTLLDHQQAFAEAGLTEAVWQRVIAVVVQPGVEFDNTSVHRFQADKTAALASFIRDVPHVVYEAHSTDYQPAQAYQQLVRQHFAILKVGPQLTFALREALFALCLIEEQLLPIEQQSCLIAICEREMQRQPDYWQAFYQVSAEQQSLLRQFSYSDRIRYYWNLPLIHAAVEKLCQNLATQAIPLPLLSQFLPVQYEAVLNGDLAATPQALIQHKIRQVTARYATACGLSVAA
jgi:D-tagatose-1,6-bisphosphate aldolase subunit GatZ/KbaZ